MFSVCVFFLFKQKTAYEMRISDWSSDVCSSDLELGVRSDAARLGQHLPALHVVTLGAAQQQARVVARLALVEQLAEHLHARDRGLLGRTDADDLDFLADLDDPALDATGRSDKTTSELPSPMRLSYAGLCLKKK